MKNAQTRFGFLAAITFCLVALACNLPVAVTPAGGGDSVEVEGALAESGYILVRDVEVTGDQLTVKVNMDVGLSETGLYSSWIYIFDSVMKTNPETKTVVIEMYSVDTPYMAVTAKADNIKALLDGEIDLREFLEKVEVEDRRASEDGLRQAIRSRGWVVTVVEVSDQRALIEGYLPSGLGKEQVVQEWFQVLQLAYDYAPSSKEVELRLLLEQPSEMTIKAQMAQIEAFVMGETDAAVFLSNLEID